MLEARLGALVPVSVAPRPMSAMRKPLGPSSKMRWRNGVSPGSLAPRVAAAGCSGGVPMGVTSVACARLRISPRPNPRKGRAAPTRMNSWGITPVAAATIVKPPAIELRIPTTLVGPLMLFTRFSTPVKETTCRPSGEMTWTSPFWVSVDLRWNSVLPLPCTRRVSPRPPVSSAAAYRMPPGTLMMPLLLSTTRVSLPQPIDLDLGDVGEREGLALGARRVGHLDVEHGGVGGVANELDGVRVARAGDLEDGRWTENREADVGDGPGPPAAGAGQKDAGAVAGGAVGVVVDELEVLDHDVGQAVAKLAPGCDWRAGRLLDDRVEAEHAAEPADQDDRVAGRAGAVVEEGDGAELRGQAAAADLDQVAGDVDEIVFEDGQVGDVLGHPDLVAADDVDALPVLGVEDDVMNDRRGALEFAAGQGPVGNVDEGAAVPAPKVEIALVVADEGDEGAVLPVLPAAVGQGGGDLHLGTFAAAARDDGGQKDVAGRPADQALVDGFTADQHPAG